MCVCVCYLRLYSACVCSSRSLISSGGLRPWSLALCHLCSLLIPAGRRMVRWTFLSSPVHTWLGVVPTCARPKAPVQIKLPQSLPVLLLLDRCSLRLCSNKTIQRRFNATGSQSCSNIQNIQRNFGFKMKHPIISKRHLVSIKNSWNDQ